MSMPQEKAQRWSRAMVLALPSDGMRHELVDGEHIVSPAPRPAHQLVTQALVRRLWPYVESSGKGEIMFLPADLSLGEDEVLQPDLFVYPTSERRPLSWLDITSLLLVVEVLSPSTARFDRLLKRHRYQRARVPEYWLVDPDGRVVERWRPDDSRPEIVDGLLEWRIVPGADAVQVDLPAMFREALGDV